MTNNYKYGEDFEMDELRASANISKILKGKAKRKKALKKKYPHASFLKNVSGVPKHWFTNKKIPKKNESIYFINAKDNYNDLIITDGLIGVYHIIYNGKGLKVVKTKKQALAYAKSYMRKH